MTPGRARALLVAAALLIFAGTAIVRAPWFGLPGRIVTSPFLLNGLLIERDWYRHGIAAERAAMHLQPRSVETDTPDARMYYSGYPPGFLLPVHTLAVLSRHEPDLRLVMGWNLFAQLLTAIALSLTVFEVARLRGADFAGADGVAAPFLFGLVPLALYLCLPGPLFLHQERFLPDQGVLLYFAIFAYCETLRGLRLPPRAARRLAGVQFFVAFMGALTEWLFGLVAICAYLIRLVRGELIPPGGSTGKAMRFVMESAKFWSPIACAMLLYALQLAWLGGTADLGQKARLWSALPGDIPWMLSLHDQFWSAHMPRAFGHIGVWLALACAALVPISFCAALVARGKRPGPVAGIVSLIFLYTVPCFAHLLILKTHSAFPLHDFSALKFALPIATIPFALAPLLFAAMFSHSPRIRIAIAAASLLAALAYCANEAPRVRPLFARNVSYDIHYEAAEFVGKYAAYDDVVFTTNLGLRIGPATPLRAFSMKQVRPATALQQMYNTLAYVDDDYTVNILYEAAAPPPAGQLGQLAEKASGTLTADGYTLIRIPKQAFLDVCAQAKLSQPPQPVPNAIKPPSHNFAAMRRAAEATEDFLAEESKNVGDT